MHIVGQSKSILLGFGTWNVRSLVDNTSTRGASLYLNRVVLFSTQSVAACGSGAVEGSLYTAVGLTKQVTLESCPPPSRGLRDC